MLFQARRFVEYFPPFALIFAAFAWAPLFESKPDPAQATSTPRLQFMSLLQSYLAVTVLLLLVVLGIVGSISPARAAVDSSKPYGLYANASLWLEINTPAGSRVFQTDWDDFPRLFYYNTHNTYLIGLDPTYLQLYDCIINPGIETYREKQRMKGFLRNLPTPVTIRKYSIQLSERLNSCASLVRIPLKPRFILVKHLSE